MKLLNPNTLFLALALLSVGVLTGCGSASDSGASQVAANSQDGPDEAGEADDHSGWWCIEHGIPEEECSMCSTRRWPTHSRPRETGARSTIGPSRSASSAIPLAPKNTPNSMKPSSATRRRNQPNRPAEDPPQAHRTSSKRIENETLFPLSREHWAAGRRILRHDAMFGL